MGLEPGQFQKVSRRTK